MKGEMKELQIILTQKSQVKNHYDVLKVLPPTSIPISSLTFKPIKHMNTEGKMVCAKLTECSFTTNTDSCRHYNTAADTAPQLLLLPLHQNTYSSDIFSKFVSHFPRQLLRLVS